MSGLQAISKLKEKNYPLQIKILVVINTAGFSILYHHLQRYNSMTFSHRGRCH